MFIYSIIREQLRTKQLTSHTVAFWIGREKSVWLCTREYSWTTHILLASVSGDSFMILHLSHRSLLRSELWGMLLPKLRWKQGHMLKPIIWILFTIIYHPEQHLMLQECSVDVAASMLMTVVTTSSHVISSEFFMIHYVLCYTSILSYTFSFFLFSFFPSPLWFTASVTVLFSTFMK